jgi:hypothetical protein
MEASQAQLVANEASTAAVAAPVPAMLAVPYADQTPVGTGAANAVRPRYGE